MLVEATGLMAAIVENAAAVADVEAVVEVEAAVVVDVTAVAVVDVTAAGTAVAEAGIRTSSLVMLSGAMRSHRDLMAESKHPFRENGPLVGMLRL